MALHATRATRDRRSCQHRQPPRVGVVGREPGRHANARRALHGRGAPGARLEAGAGAARPARTETRKAALIAAPPSCSRRSPGGGAREPRRRLDSVPSTTRARLSPALEPAGEHRGRSRTRRRFQNLAPRSDRDAPGTAHSAPYDGPRDDEPAGRTSMPPRRQAGAGHAPGAARGRKGTGFRGRGPGVKATIGRGCAGFRGLGPDHRRLGQPLPGWRRGSRRA